MTPQSEGVDVLTVRGNMNPIREMIRKAVASGDSAELREAVSGWLSGLDTTTEIADQQTTSNIEES